MADLLRLSRELEEANQQAVTGLRGFGYSWTEIAAQLGTTRQAAQQRWGR
ncbi:MAG TPA: sigma factor-like helix-turn-helix DNA-binding protein [Kineosporiaceae bacterium]|nr:sigma factor-like helix-turn-helix DNA-binding protein [Kineosporiaceae bacterium]